MENFMVDVAMPLTYVLVVLAALSAVIFPIVNAFRVDAKSLVKPMIALAVAGVLFGISWAISGNEVTAIYKTFNVAEAGSKNIGGSLIMTYILIVAAFVAVFVDKVLSFFK
jgi:ABC-type uncharacterized transport system permease subunit